MSATKERRAELKSIRKSRFGEPIGIENCELHCSDFRNLKIQDASIDCVLTDPPYGSKYIELYSDLSESAYRWLKPGGSLLVMCGQICLPETLAALNKSDLTYHWTLSYLTPGGQSVQIFPRRVNTFWKPVFWFIKGNYDDLWVGDVTKSDVNDNDKRFHNWGQSESGISDIMRRLTKPGDIVCDPFMGGGTTGIVALNTGRKFLGIEIDPKVFETGRSRIIEGTSYID